MSLPLPAWRLHRRRLRLGSIRWRQATLLPFFDAGGHIHEVLVVASNSPVLTLLPVDAIPRVGWWGEIEANRHAGSLHDVTVADARRLDPLWHYDPWWLLREPRFAGHPAKSRLKASNLYGKLSNEERMCWYRPDLSKALGTAVKVANPRIVGEPSLPYARPPARWRLKPGWR